MDGKGEHAENLRNRVDEMFEERQISMSSLSHKDLTAKGLLIEKRKYFILQRGLVSVALYITKYGKDLFISLASGERLLRRSNLPGR